MSQLRVDWEKSIFPLGQKSYDILHLSNDLDFLKWVADSGHFLSPANLVFNTLSPAFTWEIYHKQEMYHTRYGVSGLKVAYPYIGLKKEDLIVTEPLFIWDISLMPVDKMGMKWMFSRSAGVLPIVNPLILSHPEFNQISKLITPFLNHEGQDLDDFSMIIKAIDPLFFNNDIIVSIPNESVLAQQLTKLKIYHAVSLVPADNHTIKLKKEWDFSTFIPNQKRSLTGHSFGLDVLFPDQASALHVARENTHTIISGPSGSGKKFLLTHMISNALSNGRSCLILSENNGFFTSLNQRLAKDNVENLVLSQPPKEQYGQLLKRVAFIIQQEKNSPVFAGDNFKEILASCQRLFLKLSAAFNASRKKIFGENDWAEVVSLFLQSTRGSENELINIRLPTDHFHFNPEEFNALIAEIEPLQERFASINTLQHPLNILHTGVLNDADCEEVSDYFNLQLNEERNNFRLILSAYLKVLTQYSDDLNISLFNLMQGIISGLEEIENKIEGYIDLYGNDFLYTKHFSLLFYSKLAERGKKILAARENISVLFESIITSIKEQTLWSFPPVPENTDPDQITALIGYVKELKESAINWQHHLPEFINEEVLRASGNNVNPYSSLKNQFIYLENLMDEAIEKFNAKSLFLEKLEHQALTLIKRQKWLESVVNKLDLILLNIRDFHVFYHWQLSWKVLSPAAKSIVQALSTINPKDWVMTFKNWYLHQVLLRHYNLQLPDNSLPLETYEADWELLQRMLPRQIQSVWFQKRRERMKQLRKEEKSTLQKIIGWIEKGDLNERDYLLFLKDIMPLWQECFPVFCLTVAQAKELFDQYPAIQFDHVYWGDAQYSTPEDLARFQILGKHGTYFYHSSFVSEFFRVYPHVKLTKIHGFYQGNPWQQWQGGQVTVNSLKDASVYFSSIEGIMQPNGINEEEALFLLNELSGIRYTTTENIPTVGIICMTETQRNFISTLIFKVQNEDSDLNNHFNNLVNNGLAVLLPDEIESRHFDLVYLMTTFEKITDLKVNFPSLNKMTEPLAALPTVKMTVITSFKREALIDMEDEDNIGLFVSYIKLLEAIHDRDRYAMEYEFQKFKPENEEIFKENDHLFWSELMFRFRSQTTGFEFRQHIFFNQDFFPFFIEKQTATSAYIFFLLDGFHAHTSHTDFIWEVRQTNRLRKYDITLIPVWTVNWWKNNGMELKRLISNIHAMN
ncbi:MAG: hypothetical protein KGQ86_00545 [Bacteroidetes bacterium]|nr:hypothetical protein [Bacteroidota bacterium]